MDLFLAVLVIVLGVVLGWIVLVLFFKAILKGIQWVYAAFMKGQQYYPAVMKNGPQTQRRGAGD